MTTTTRVTVTGALAGLALSALTVVAPPSANAAWSTWVGTHGAKAQVCQVPLAGGSARLKIRLDNRGADHWHRVTLFRTRDGRTQEVEVRAGAGRTSGTAALVWSRGDEAGVTLHHPDGGAAGGLVAPGQVRRC
jgi:hypothetical protein